MKYRVIIQPTAAELQEAYRWYYNESPAAASRWLDKLLETVDTLRTDPERCALAPENDAFEETIRQLLHGKKRGTYRILFTIKEGVVELLHVRHAAERTRQARQGLDQPRPSRLSNDGLALTGIQRSRRRSDSSEPLGSTTRSGQSLRRAPSPSGLARSVVVRADCISTLARHVRQTPNQANSPRASSC